MTRKGHDVINLGIGQPDFPIAQHILDAAERAVRDGPYGYSSAQGESALREAVSERYCNENYPVSPDNVVVLPGAKTGLLFATLSFGDAESQVLYPDPGFPIYSSVARFSGADPIAYPLDENSGFGLRAGDILSRITKKTRLLILNSPGNPTGGVTTNAELDLLVRGLLDYPDVFILSDEIYRQIHYGQDKPRSLLHYPEIRERLILIDGCSKTYAMTGWRLGFSVWPTSLINLVNRLCINSHSCVNNVAQAAGKAALTGPQDSVDSMITTFTRRKTILVEALNEIPGISALSPGGAFYVFPNITKIGKTSLELQTELLDFAHVATIAGTSFGSAGEGFLRLSFATDQSRLEEACERISIYLNR